MGQQGCTIFTATNEHGIPEPWLSFGDCLCRESAHATELKRMIEVARKEQDATYLDSGARWFEFG